MTLDAIKSYEDEFETIASIFQTGWVSGSPAEPVTPIIWPGISSSVPTDANGKAVDYVMFFITNGGCEQVSIGGNANVFRHIGIVSCKIFCLTGRGEIPAKKYADKFCDIFRGYSVDGLRFYAPYSVIIGDTNDGYYQINTFAPFERDSYL